MDYPVETFTDDERALLAAHFTNLDRPVFALVGLPETVKGALFARYSRYGGTLRRLFLDEFAADLEATSGGPAHPLGVGADGEPGAGAGGARERGSARADRLYERVFLGFGDDSVAQLGGAHVACEWVSNVLTKVLQRPRLGAYLEQSTRYIAYDAPMPGGGARFYRDPALGEGYERAMQELFDIYARSLAGMREWALRAYPKAPGEPDAAHARAVRAKALDLVRGLLPAASLSHMGIYASGQTYEQLIMHLLAHPLPEARHYGELILDAVRSVMPSFVSRVTVPERGGEWIAYLRGRDETARRVAARLGLDRREPHDVPGAAEPSVTLLHHSGDELGLLAALLFEAGEASERDARETLGILDAPARAALLAELVGERPNRRHRPGRGLEALRYRFEIVSDYGAFRDLQRHRMLTVQWQSLTPHLGAAVPEEVDAAGFGDDYRRGLEISRAAWAGLCDAGLRQAAPYALCLGYRIRYVLDLNARAAMQLIELRSGREGHPSYRAIAQRMHASIAEVHPGVAAAMGHVDMSAEPRLERIGAEVRAHARGALT